MIRDRVGLSYFGIILLSDCLCMKRDMNWIASQCQDGYNGRFLWVCLDAIFLSFRGGGGGEKDTKIYNLFSMTPLYVFASRRLLAIPSRGEHLITPQEVVY